MEHICEFCGSTNTKTVGGINGNPFDRTPEKVICVDCGRVIFDASKLKLDVDSIPDSPVSSKKWYLRIEITASASWRSEKFDMRIPKEDGVYDLSENDHPALAHFHTLKIEGQSVWFNDEEILLTRSPMSRVLKFTAYGPDRVGYEETVEITLTEEAEDFDCD